MMGRRRELWAAATLCGLMACSAEPAQDAPPLLAGDSMQPATSTTPQGMPAPGAAPVAMDDSTGTVDSAGMQPTPPPQTTPEPGPQDGQAGAPAMDPGADDGADPGDPPAGGTLPPVDSVDGMGPFEVTIEQGQSPGGGWVAYPSDLGRDGIKHPIFVWGCGGGSQPSQYEDHLRMIASHGFVMEAHVSSGTASDHDEPLTWLLAENDNPSSVYYQKLDTTKIAAGGHSMGSIATFAFEGDTDLLTTSIHVAGGSFDGNGYMRLKTPTLMVGGVNDTLAGANTDRDFERTTVPTFYTNIEDTDHILAARAGLPPMIAWMRWHLAGEEERSSMFLGDGCDFCGGTWNGMSKNF